MKQTEKNERQHAHAESILPVAIVQDLEGKCYMEKKEYAKSNIIEKYNLKKFVAYTFNLKEKKLTIDFSTLENKEVEKYKEIVQSFVNENFTAEKLCEWIEENFDSRIESGLIELLTKKGREEYEKAIEKASNNFAEANLEAWKFCIANYEYSKMWEKLRNENKKAREEYEKAKAAEFVKIFCNEENRIAVWR